MDAGKPELSDDALYSLTNIFSNQNLSKGEFVITEGSEGDHFYVVHDGTVLVTQWSTSLQGSVELDTLGSGQ
jgi:CRP-like cAMP-binding protein